jgi:hypothetical protein
MSDEIAAARFEGLFLGFFLAFFVMILANEVGWI